MVAGATKLYLFYYLFTIIKAPITPGIQPQQVKIKTSTNEPQPLSATAKGGKMMHSSTLQIDMVVSLLPPNISENKLPTKQ